MDKLLISIGCNFDFMDTYLRFDIRSNEFDLEKHQWAFIKIERTNEMFPYECYEIDKNKKNLQGIIKLLQTYLNNIENNNESISLSIQT